MYTVRWPGGSRTVRGPLEARRASRYVWQVGAWAEPASAAHAAARLDAALGEAARVWRETAPSGLVRVRVAFSDGAAGARQQLAEAGFPGALRVAVASVQLDTAEGAVTLEPPVELVPEGDWPTAVGGRRYRGTFHLVPGPDGLRVIDRVPLEQYLRGVVPAEMGPHVFPELEALKAQAVAARTYAVAHLGDHEDEGYDLCDTPACQVYRGAGAEHPLTDRAVAETAGVVAVYGSEPIDAMYTSTCGGHTEDAAALFPDRAAPYLVGVPCAWDRPLELAGSGTGGPWTDRTAFRSELTRAALGTPAGDTLAALEALASRCAGTAPNPPVDASPEGWAGAVLAASGLAGAAALEGNGTALDRLLALADRHHVPLARPGSADPAAWRYAALAAALQLQGIVTTDHGEAVPRPEGPGIDPSGGDRSEPLALPAPLWERWNGSYRPAAALTVLPGTRLERYRVGDTVLALVAVRSEGDGEADRRSHWRWWARDRSWDWLERRTGVRGLRTLEVTRRTPSGRVVGLRATGTGGTVREWSGFAVRQLLQLPETLFAFHVLERDGQRVARFLGRGWGHGVGLCQNGAYGLARAGMTYDRILRHYYTGIDLVRLEPTRHSPDTSATTPNR